MKNLTKTILLLGGSFALGIAGAQTVNFSYMPSMQTWTVPCGVTTITIAATGGSGGNGNGSVGGDGATIIGSVTATPGDIINIYTGGQGTSNFNDDGGAGGGGSFVYDATTSTLLEVAGGGGGAYYYNFNGYNGSTTTTPTGQNGGSGENGGAAIATDAGGAGAGFLSNGATNGNAQAGTGGMDFANGLAGGAGDATYDPGVVGGYGGGGGGGYDDGGGAGGYNGGGSGSEDGGGGGGSYVNGTTLSATAVSIGNGSVTINWVVPAAPVVTANAVSNVSCNGGSNGSANETVTGGSTPYTYLWTPSAQTNATATGLSAGTYTIGVTDACGNTASASVAITEPTALMASASASSNVTCNAGSDGATSSTVSGGTTPYTYAWTGGSTNATATGLSAGTYTLNVTDMNGCTATASAVVTQPNALAIDTTYATANVLCHGDSTGSAFVMAGSGTMPYTYTWTPSGGTTDSAVGLKAGAYTITVNDACGETATAMVNITEPTAISLSSASTPDNGSHNGTATVTATGGVMPYTFLWSPGGNTTASISGKDSGMYCCTVTDSNGCTANTCVHIKSIAGIQGISSSNGQISVYPNPNNGEFTMESSISGASVVEIYNLLGEKVFTKNLSTTKGTNQINVSNQPNGVYLYRVISESGDLLGQGKITLQK